MSISNISIFDISLIVDTICEFLSLSDIENCLHVNKNWCALFLPNTWTTVYLLKRPIGDGHPHCLTKDQQDKVIMHHHKILHLTVDGIPAENFMDIALSCKKLKSLLVRESWAMTTDKRQLVNNSDVPSPQHHNNLFSIAIDTLAANPGLQSLELYVADDEDEILRKSLISTLAAHKSISSLKWDLVSCKRFSGFEIRVSEVISLMDHLPDTITELELVYVEEGYWDPNWGITLRSIADYFVYNINDTPMPIYSPMKAFNLMTLRIHVDSFELPLDSSVIIPILEHSPYLEELSLPGWNPNLLEKLGSVLNKSCRLLRNLDICHCNASDENISQLIIGLSDLGLESLTAGFRGDDLKDTISTLADSRLCSTLTQLHSRNIRMNMKSNDLVWLLDHLVSLKDLTLKPMWIDNAPHVGIPLRALVKSLENNPRRYMYKVESLKISLVDDVLKEWDNDNQYYLLIEWLVRLHRVLRKLPRLRLLHLYWDIYGERLAISDAVRYAQTLRLYGEQAMTYKDFMWIGYPYLLTSSKDSELHTLEQHIQEQEEKKGQ
ncbi:hypothetical protein BGZ76_010361, partial [Entomortierella beljakovae]